MELQQGKAPRTTQVIGREKIKASQQGVLDAAEESQIVTRRLAAEGMRDAVRGMETGTGARVAQQRRAAQELADQQILQDVGIAEKDLEFQRELLTLGSLEDDRMLKIETYDDLIQKMRDNGFDDFKIGRRINRYIQNEKDQFMVDHLMERGANYLEAYNKSLGAQPKPDNPSLGEKVEKGLENAFSFIPGVGD
tara:strand:+ start:3474 stop:4055 length:582 start_codon:yes stop_codon:yes gene_type:complete